MSRTAARKLTRPFKATVQARIQADPKFRDALLREGVETVLARLVTSIRFMYSSSSTAK